MNIRLIVLHDKTTSQQDKAFNEWLKAEGIGWWRWFDGSWLLDSSSDNHTADKVRDKFIEIVPKVNVLVLELKADGNDTWAGFGPSSKEENMFKWIRRTWKRI